MPLFDARRTGAAARWLGGLALLLAALAAGAAPATPALWRVSGAAGNGHLFGSVHLGQQALYPLPDAVERAFASADVLAVELDVERLSGAQRSRAVRETGLYPPGTQLSDRTGAALWQRLEGACAALAMNCAALQPLRPWLAAMTLSMRTLERAGYAADGGVDVHFLRRARASHEVVSLETLGGQLAYFDALPDADQIAFLAETTEQLAEAGAYITDVFDAWARGDVPAIDTLVNDELRRSAARGLYQAVIVRRNAHMVARVDALLRAGRQPFVVVGAGHLAGPDSVVGGLRARGWRVERVRY